MTFHFDNFLIGCLLLGFTFKFVRWLFRNARPSNGWTDHGEYRIYRIDGWTYYLYGNQYHREDGPAISSPDGKEFWYYRDKLHRKDGPAIVFPGLYKAWWLNHKPHREDGPWREYENGDKEYAINGLLHNENGPAFDHADFKQWWVNGVFIRQESPTDTQ
jgi:hypothetical protein